MVDSGVGASSTRGRKRKKADMEESDLKPKLSTGGGLACPFYKDNTYKHVDCLCYSNFKELKYLKLHLDRCHLWPDYYCPSCLEKFEDPGQRDEHIVARECPQRKLPYSGVSHDQQGKIKQITSVRRSGKTDKDKWYEIWDVLFPGKERPDSPHRYQVEHEIALTIMQGGYLQTSRFQQILASHWPELPGDQEQRMIDFISDMLKDHARYAEAKRANATAGVPSAELLMLNQWVHEGPGEESNVVE
ncbi:hypothetical protein PG996_007855 [Apiospora saccharicola]|uniref:C2H2-type domain-containing protein n=1 Tax=Apiospora saccharicola TaxID=335842 RepID=A0ABR1UW94_9PEZI